MRGMSAVKCGARKGAKRGLSDKHAGYDDDVGGRESKISMSIKQCRIITGHEHQNFVRGYEVQEKGLERMMRLPEGG